MLFPLIGGSQKCRDVLLKYSGDKVRYLYCRKDHVGIRIGHIAILSAHLYKKEKHLSRRKEHRGSNDKHVGIPPAQPIKKILDLKNQTEKRRKSVVRKNRTTENTIIRIEGFVKIQR